MKASVYQTANNGLTLLVEAQNEYEAIVLKAWNSDHNATRGSLVLNHPSFVDPLSTQKYEHEPDESQR